MKYFGTYADFTIAPELAPGYLTGPDNAVGDILDVVVDLEDGTHRAWLVNRFGKRIGYLDDALSGKLALLSADDMTCHAILSFVAYTSYTDKEKSQVSSKSEKNRSDTSVLKDDNRAKDSSKEQNDSSKQQKANYSNYGYYWGNVAIVCFSRSDEVAGNAFVQNIAERIGRDVRPKLDLGVEGANQIVESNGNWVPAQTVKLPETKPNMAFIKRRRQPLERLIDQGRARNKGCYVLTIAFIIGLIVVLAFAVKGCIG